jgi:hypothetical protein
VWIPLLAQKSGDIPLRIGRQALHLQMTRSSLAAIMPFITQSKAITDRLIGASTWRAFSMRQEAGRRCQAIVCCSKATTTGYIAFTGGLAA